MSDFQNKIKQENGHIDNLSTHNLEQTPQLPRGHINKVDLPLLTRLLSNKMLPLNIIILTQELQELERPSISSNTQLMIQMLISGVGFKDIFSETVALVDVEVVIVVNRCRAEVVL